MIQSFFTCVFLFYLTLQSRYIFGGDSAEFSTVAKTWGISHPPGYPLYSLLVNLLDKLLPFGTTPWKIALLSSIPTVLTAFIIYNILRLIKVRPIFSLVSSLFYLVLFPVWQYALIPEVFALHSLLTSLITYLLLKFDKTKKNALLIQASFLCGLCISHHHIFVLFIVGWLLTIRNDIRKIVASKKILIQLLCGVLLGASFYLYAIVASLHHTVLDWENAKTLQGFFNLVTRSSYGSFKAYSGSGANIVNQLADVLSGITFVLIDYRPLGIFFILIGLAVSHRYSKQCSVFLLSSLLLHFLFLFYTNFTLSTSFSSGMFERFLIPIYFLLSLALGIGIDFIYIKSAVFIRKRIRNCLLQKVVMAAYCVFIITFVFIVACANFRSISLLSKVNEFDTLGKDIVHSLPKRALFSLQTDTPTFTSMYHVYGLKERKDVVLLQVGLMGRQNYVDMLKQRTPELKLTSPLVKNDDFTRFISAHGDREYFSEQPGSFGYWLPYGLLWKYFPTEEAVKKNQDEVISINKRLWDTYTIPTLTPYEKNILHLLSVQDYYINAYISFSKLLIVNGRLEEAKQILHTVVHTYGTTDQTTRLALLNILVLTKDCKSAQKEAQTMKLSTFIEENPASAESIITYYKTCDIANSELKKAEQKLIEYTQKSNSSLHSL